MLLTLILIIVCLCVCSDYLVYSFIFSAKKKNYNVLSLIITFDKPGIFYFKLVNV